jgi:hypothetical protein
MSKFKFNPFTGKLDNVASTPTDVGLSNVKNVDTTVAGNVVVTTQNVGNSTNLDTFITNLDDSQTGESDSGFGAWTTGADASTYTISGGNFTVDRSGYGYKNGKKITFNASQSVALGGSNTCSYIYVDSAGTLQVTTARATAFTGGFVLYEVLNDGTNYDVVRENHPFSFDSQSSAYLHSAVGTIIFGLGAISTRVATGTGASADDRRIKIVGADTLSDHGISTTIAEVNPAVWSIYYKNGSSKWIQYAKQSELPMKYNNAGTVTDLAVTTTIYSVYTLYCSKDDIESASPTYFACLSGAYATSADAITAIGNGSVAFADNELKELELAQLGYAIMMYSVTGGYIFSITIAKSTLNQQLVGGSAGASHSSLSGLGNDDHTQYELAAGSGVDNAIARIDGTSGRQLQTSLATIDDTGSINIPTGQSYKINAAAITTANVADSTNKRYVSDAQLVVIGNTSNTNSGDNAANSTADMLLGTVQSVTAEKKFTNSKLTILGSSTGKNTFTMANSSATDYVTTVPAATGTLALTSDIVSQVEDNITDGHTTIAPSGNAVFDALALKAPLISPSFTTPALGTPSSGTLSSCSGYPAATTSTAGLAPIVTAPAANILNVVGVANGETAYSIKTILDQTATPSTQAFGDTAVKGTSLVAAHVDHKHAMMAAPTTITGNAGTATKLAATKNINGVAFDGSADITIPSILWTEVTGTTQALAVNNGYILNNASQVVATLPSTAAVGTMIEISGKGAGGWKVAQNASQLIRFGSSVTTTGTGGYLSSTNAYDCIRLLCIIANTTWIVLSSVGNITVA